MLKVIDFCAGVGGMSMTFHNDPKFEMVAFIENNKYASSVLKYHHPEIPNYGDATKIKPSELPDCDIIIGGTPCQSFSVAGTRTGFDGKSGLFSTFIETIKEKKPSYFIWENVKGSFNSTNGFDFARVQIEMAEAGYDVRYELLNAKNFGIPQNRERVFAIGCLRGRGCSQVLFDTGSHQEDINHGEVGVESAYAITSTYHKGTNTTNRRGRQLIACSSSGRNGYRDERIKVGEANTLNTGDGCRGQSTVNYVVDDIRIRKITPLECERLMGWPDNYTLSGIIDGKTVEISDTQRYTMCGNGVVSAMMEPIKELILKLDSVPEMMYYQP